MHLQTSYIDYVVLGITPIHRAKLWISDHGECIYGLVLLKHQ